MESMKKDCNLNSTAHTIDWDMTLGSSIDRYTTIIDQMLHLDY